VSDLTPKATSLSSPQRALPTLRIATYNIHKGVLRELFGLRHVNRIHELRTRLHEINADVILLQEVQGQHDRHAARFEQWPDEPQDTFLAKSPALKRVFQSAYGNNAQYLHGHHGNALLSRFPIVREENRDVSDHAMEKRGVLHCVLKISGQEVHVFVVHFGLLARSRTRQLQAVIDWANKVVPAQAPMIIGGDFNDWRNRLSHKLTSSLNLREVFDLQGPQQTRAQSLIKMVGSKLNDMGAKIDQRHLQLPRRLRAARTFPALIPWLRMDRIYVRGFDVDAVQVLGGPQWARLSDHSPLVADLRIAADGH
jgi:endonuclease/exonuclease/phosphatase family metal-dependent hydrolase